MPEIFLWESNQGVEKRLLKDCKPCSHYGKQLDTRKERAITEQYLGKRAEFVSKLLELKEGHPCLRVVLMQNLGFQTIKTSL